MQQRSKPARLRIHSRSTPCRPHSITVVLHVLRGHLAHGEGDGGSLEGGGDSVGVDLDEADEKAGTGGERIVPNDVARGEQQDGCFEGGDSLLAESCGHAMSKGTGM